MDKYKILITLESGMMIGSGNDEFKLGGVDASTITINEKPYIPGSSLKGKLRSLSNEQQQEEINKYFGGNNDDQGNLNMSNRILFSDLLLEGNEEKKDRNYFEIKYENSITEEKKKKKMATPRINKRTTSNLVFEGKVMIPQNNSEAEELLKKLLKELKQGYIGSNGSRGYGWVKEAELTKI